MSDDINDRVSDGVREAMKNEVFKRGLAVRRQVVGDAYVDASLLAADDFSLPIQELATKYCWGEAGRARTCPGRPEASSTSA